MRALLISILVLMATTCAAFAQDGSSSGEDARCSRLLGLGKLWSYVAWIHPYLAYRQIDWDQAFVSALEQAENASSREEYANATNNMLAALNDPLTHVVRDASNETTGEMIKEPRKLMRIDSNVAVFDLRNLNNAECTALKTQILTALEECRGADGIVFDLRNNAANWVRIDELFDTDTAAPLCRQRVVAPTTRARLHIGFAPENGRSYGNYSSSMTIQEAESFHPTDWHTEGHVLFLINRFSQIPKVALALQSEGYTCIASEGKVDDYPLIRTMLFELPQKVTAAVRTNELLYHDGQIGLRIDHEFARSDDLGAESALEHAVEAVKHKHEHRRTAGIDVIPVKGNQLHQPEVATPFRRGHIE